MVYQTNQNLSQKDIIEKSHIVLLQPGHILRVKWLAETVGRSFGWKVFFFGVPQLPAKWEFYQETWEVHRKDAPWPLACDNHVGPLVVLLRSTRLRAALEADTSQMRGEWCSISLSWFLSYLKFAN